METPRDTLARATAIEHAAIAGREARPGRGRQVARLLSEALRLEDWLIAGWVGLAAPAIFAAQGSSGPFEPGRPLDGLIRLLGFGGALVCLATRSSDGPALAETPVLQGAAIGPLTGGLLLVGGSAMASFGLDPAVAFGPTLLAVLAFALLGTHLPAIRTSIRRALVVPFALASGGLFWGVVRAIAGSGDVTGQVGQAIRSDPQGAGLVVAALVAGAAVYYAMLIYAPRQVAEREGGPIVWLVRFGLFLVGVGLGLGWLSVLGS
jgi:hypothetical protein